MAPHSTTVVPPTLARHDFIDALRGFAFLAVLVHHAASRVPNLNRSVLRIAEQGHEGVELFFLVSALTLFLSLDSRRRLERRPVLNFFIRRYFRIAPLFYTGALFYFVFDRFMTGGAGSGGTSPGGILATLLFVNGWTVRWINRLVPGGWSIAVEMNFYLMVPWLFRKLRGMQEAVSLAFAALIAGAGASIAARWFLQYARIGVSGDEIGRFVWYWLPAQLPIFCLGFVLFFILRPILKGGDRQADRPQPDPGFLLMFGGYLIVAVTFSEPAFYLGHFLFGVAFLAIAWSLALHPAALLVNPVTRHIGKVSFSAYISHFAVLDLVERGLPRYLPASAAFRPEVQFVAFVAVCTALTVLVSTITYRMIEVPGQDVGRRLIQYLESRAALKGIVPNPLDAVLHPADEAPPSRIIVPTTEPVVGP